MVNRNRRKTDWILGLSRILPVSTLGKGLVLHFRNADNSTIDNVVLVLVDGVPKMLLGIMVFPGVLAMIPSITNHWPGQAVYQLLCISLLMVCQHL